MSMSFKFCTRENPSRLTVSLFGGGFFFGLTLDANGLQVFEGAIEFGAAMLGRLRRRLRQRLGDGRALFQDRRRRLHAGRLLPASRRGRGARHRLGLHRAVPRDALRIGKRQVRRHGHHQHRGRRRALQRHRRDQRARRSSPGRAPTRRWPSSWTSSPTRRHQTGTRIAWPSPEGAR